MGNVANQLQSQQKSKRHLVSVAVHCTIDIEVEKPEIARLVNGMEW